MERYSSYKDSGISWIGDIPSHWEVCRMKRVFSEAKEKTISEEGTLLSLSQYTGITLKDDAKKVGMFEAESTIGYNVVHPGQFVMNIMLAWNGSYAVSDYEGIITPSYCVFNFNEDCEKKYFHYLLRLPAYAGAFKTMSKGIIESRLRLYPIYFLAFKTIIPPQDEQRTIVDYIEDKTSKIDAYVADKEKEIELLQELKQKTIADAVTKGLNPDAKMKDSGISWIGEIPEHWEVKRIASLFTGKVQANSDFKYHHAFKFYYGTLVPKNEVGDVEEYRDTYVKYSVLQKDDIMINGLNLNYDFVSQRVAIAPSDGIITSAYVVARPRKDTNAQYYNYLFKTMDNMKLFHGMGTGIRLTLSFDEMKKQVVVVPPQDEQQAIVAYIEEKCQKIDKLASELQSEIDYLKEYKQRLIADCVTGQVKVC